jgi:hypothetical protein
MILKDKHTEYTSEEKILQEFKKGNIRSCEKVLFSAVISPGMNMNFENSKKLFLNLNLFNKCKSELLPSHGSRRSFKNFKTNNFD